VKNLHPALASAYVIKTEKMTLHIAILDIDTLLLHEEAIPELLERLITSIKND
jgi:hypothetical protein